MKRGTSNIKCMVVAYSIPMTTPSWISLEQVVVSTSGIKPPGCTALQGSKSEHIFNTIVHLAACLEKKEHSSVSLRMLKSEADVRLTYQLIVVGPPYYDTLVLDNHPWIMTIFLGNMSGASIFSAELATSPDPPSQKQTCRRGRPLCILLQDMSLDDLYLWFLS